MLSIGHQWEAVVVKTLAIVATLFATSAAAQSASYETNRPAPITGDADKMVCKKQETIGSRLGAKKVCLTVREWQARELADREQAQGVQSGTRGPCAETDCTNATGKIF
jgi:hypothetical protein